jgi:hypothetical protein
LRAVRFSGLASALALAVAMAGGCLDAALPNGRARCAAVAPRCPSDYYCAADDTCWRAGSGPDLSVALAPPDMAAGAAAGHDLSSSDLAGGDVGRVPACAGLFCDSFESDVAGSSAITASDGATRWSLYGTVPTYAVVDIDPTLGALGTSHSLRVRLSAMQSGGMISPMYQRDTPVMMLNASVPNYVRILNGPTYTRFFVKLTAEIHATLGYLDFGAGDPGDFEIDAEPDGASFNTRFSFTTPMFTRNTLAVSWTGDWVCVEWENRFVPADAGVRFRSSISINGSVAATFEGGGTPSTAVEQQLAADQEFRSDVPAFVDFTQWIDQVIISDQPVGCN